jgi:hypothetical protein
MNYTPITPVAQPPTVLIFNINETVHQYGECLYTTGIDLELLFNEMIKVMRFKAKCPEIFTLLAQGTIDKSAPLTAEEAVAVQQAVVSIGEAIWRKLVRHGVYGSEYMGQYYVLQLTFSNDLVLVRDVQYREPHIQATYDVPERELDKTDDIPAVVHDDDLVPF